MQQDWLMALWREAEHLELPVVADRVPGVSVRFLESSFGKAVPSEVAGWFGACNGVMHRSGQIQNDAALIPGYEPLSVEDSLSIRVAYPREAILLSDFYPLLGSGGGDFYAASYDQDAGLSYVVSVVVGEESRIAYRSISQMAESFVQCYRDGIFFLDGEGVLQADDEAWIQREIAAAGELPL
ncbi:hypothetical protein [Streptomyces drozdowiczii]|uniref:Knr4/Smi1-like domain-containing protein n=1 Tax=Streptomyces drozdowiczii TaxID=202862 RepID=A0ABY6PRI2_9ACTN|nr:hypothetical protein [Streptomyces drozdowiczii]MCX0245654.1 hypothetical protein [Streptomyces drozdowiczii]UZK54732.1 hypothetical protein NEH16_11805 [Streptomyces drozdowiczii]